MKNEVDNLKYFDNEPGGEYINDEQRSKEIQYEQNLRELDIYWNKVFDYYYQRRSKFAEKDQKFIHKSKLLILNFRSSDRLW